MRKAGLELEMAGDKDKNVWTTFLRSSFLVVSVWTTI